MSLELQIMRLRWTKMTLIESTVEDNCCLIIHSNALHITPLSHNVTNKTYIINVVDGPRTLCLMHLSFHNSLFPECWSYSFNLFTMTPLSRMENDRSRPYSIITNPWNSLQSCHHRTPLCPSVCFQMSYMCQITIKSRLEPHKCFLQWT